MTIREIITVPDPRLRRVAQPVGEFDAERLHWLINDMIDTMREANGLGLSAPQIGVPLRIIVAEADLAPTEISPVHVIINPEITAASPEMVLDVEGCLSLPGVIGQVDRHEKITVIGKSPEGIGIRIVAASQLTRVLQHEIDHLNGVLFIDRAVKIWNQESDGRFRWQR